MGVGGHATDGASDGIRDADVTILLGDALEQLRSLEDCSVQCIVTSPPFWNLRDYGEVAQIGLEPSPEEWVDRLVEVFRECRRVLRDDGVFWLEVGDSYADRANVRTDGQSYRADRAEVLPAKRNSIAAGRKAKDLVGAPWMLAFALRADGWWLRSECIWGRPNPMPESIVDRPTKAHSQVFLLSKRERYFFDGDAVRTPAAPDSRARSLRGSRYDDPAQRELVPYASARPRMRSLPRSVREGVDTNGGGQGSGEMTFPVDTANLRSVWWIGTESTDFKHYATMPQRLAELCILAGTSERGCCARCGAPWRRLVEATAPDGRTAIIRGGVARDDQGEPLMGDNMIDPGVRGSFNSGGETLSRSTAGWEQTCSCSSDGTPCGVQPCVVLDPFMGSGTTALVARRLGRHAVGVELSPEYLEIARQRLAQLSLLA